MAVKIKFPLKMNGMEVRTIEELRERFDMEAVLSYYDNGRLTKWLTDRYYDEEAEKVKSLDSSSYDFKKSLCEILGVSYSGNETDRLDLKDISKKNERRARLKQFTADDRILRLVDSVAFTQEELVELLNRGIRDIYLCGEQFIIPGDVGNVIYRGVNSPIVQFDGNCIEAGVDVFDVEFSIEDMEFFEYFDKNPMLGIKLLHMEVQKGSARLQSRLGICYANGWGVEKNKKEAVKWWKKAAEQGRAAAQYNLGRYYLHGWGIEKNEKEAVEWYRKAAEQGYVDAQFKLGVCYANGSGVEKDEEEAVKWYRKAAEQRYKRAQYNLGVCYWKGSGVEKNEKEAAKWLKKSFEQGYKDAESLLMEIEPKLFKLSKVILYAVGGRDNLYAEANLNMKTKEIGIWVNDRNKVNTTILSKFGAANVWIETKYDISFKEKNHIMEGLKKGLLYGGPVGAVIGGVVGAMADTEIETVTEDMGKGYVHMQLMEIDSDMEEDFNTNVKRAQQKEG